MLLITMMLTQAGLAENTAKVQGRYTPRNGSEPTFSSYMKSIRVNQETGLIDPALMINSEEATREGEMNWIVAGPDNFGALTRAMVFDKNDASGQTVYIGTMGGHIFKTTNNGITFQQVSETNLNISCMVQAVVEPQRLTVLRALAKRQALQEQVSTDLQTGILRSLHRQNRQRQTAGHSLTTCSSQEARFTPPQMEES